MAFKTAAPCDLLRENMGLNSASYSTTNGVDSDVFRELSGITQGMPARLTHTGDSTAYSTPPLEDSWIIRLRQGWTPANKGGDGTIGNTV